MINNINWLKHILQIQQIHLQFIVYTLMTDTRFMKSNYNLFENKYL